MGDLRGINCESETDMDEIVDEVFTFFVEKQNNKFLIDNVEC